MAEVNLDMMMVMSAMSAMSSDDAKARTFQEIAAKAQELVAIQNDANRKLEAATAEREEARKDRLAAESARAEIGNREAALAAETDGLAAAHKAHAAEVENYGKMRAQIDADHAAAQQDLTDREAKVLADEQRHHAKDTELAARESAVRAKEDSLARKHAALTQAMAA